MNDAATSTRILDTYLRGIERLAAVAVEVEALEREVAGREAEALRALLDALRPLVPQLARPVSIREPWLGSGVDRPFRERGVPVTQSFQQDREAGGRITHHGEVLLLLEDGRLLELQLHGSWREGPPVTEATWRVEASERALTPTWARANLRAVLVGLLDCLREALVKGRAERDALRARLDLLEQVDALLREG